MDHEELENLDFKPQRRALFESRRVFFWATSSKKKRSAAQYPNNVIFALRKNDVTRSGSSILVPLAALGLAAVAAGMGSEEKSPRETLKTTLGKELKPPMFTGLFDGGATYPVNLNPREVVALFTEWRTDAAGPVGSTRINLKHTSLGDQIYVQEPVDVVREKLGIDLVRVTWRPDWEPMLAKPSSSEKAQRHLVWVNPAQVSSIGPSNIFSQRKRTVLGAVYMKDGLMLDMLLETWPQIKELFASFPIPIRRWHQHG